MFLVKDRMKQIKNFMISGNFFEENNLKGTKMKELESVKSIRFNIDDFIKDLNYFNELPKNNVFNKLRIDVGKNTFF